MILAIDPGTRESGVVGLHADGVRVLSPSDVLPNDELLDKIGVRFGPIGMASMPGYLVIEMVEHYGADIRAGSEVFETCVWIGQFLLKGKLTPMCSPHRVTRRTVKLHLCGSPRANDADVKQAIVDRYGGKAAAIGTKKAPGPLYGVKSHAWQALAVALTFHDLGDKACYRGPG